MARSRFSNVASELAALLRLGQGGSAGAREWQKILGLKGDERLAQMVAHTLFADPYVAYFLAVHATDPSDKEELIRFGRDAGKVDHSIVVGYAIAYHWQIFLNQRHAQYDYIDRSGTLSTVWLPAQQFASLISLFSGLSLSDVQRALMFLDLLITPDEEEGVRYYTVSVGEFANPDAWMRPREKTLDDFLRRRIMDDEDEEFVPPAAFTAPAPPPAPVRQPAPPKRTPRVRRPRRTGRNLLSLRVILLPKVRRRVTQKAATTGRATPPSAPATPAPAPLPDLPQITIEASRPSAPARPPEPRGPDPLKQGRLRANFDVGDEIVAQREAEKGQSLTRKAEKRTRDVAKEAAEEARNRLQEIAHDIAEAVTQQFNAEAPSHVARTDPIKVIAIRRGSTFGFELRGGPEAMKWARIIESGSSDTDLMNVARLSRKRRAVKIYRAKPGRNGVWLKRAKNEAEPGYYYTIPLVYGRGVINSKGKIDITEHVRRKRYQDGREYSVGLQRKDIAELNKRIATYQGEETQETELEDDFANAYAGLRGWERQEDSSPDTPQYRLGPNAAISRIEGTEGNRRRVMEGDAPVRQNQRSRYRLPDSWRQQAQPKTGKKAERWAQDRKTGRWYRTVAGVDASRTVSHDPLMPWGTKQGDDLNRRTDGFVHFRPAPGSNKGDVVRFRRISTRGTAPLKPVPGRMAKHYLRDATDALRSAIRDEIATLSTRKATIHRDALIAVFQSAL